MKKCLTCNKELSERNNLSWFCSLKCKKEYHKDSKCLYCNTPFIPFRLDSRFCSKLCCNNYHHKVRHDKGFKWKVEKRCGICKMIFIPNGVTQRFCSYPCQYKNERGFFPKEIKEKKCNVCKKLFLGGLKTKYCSVKCRRKFDYIKNKERKILYNTEWGRKNKDKRKKYQKTWKDNHYEHHLFNKRKQAHIRRKVGGSFTKQEWEAIIERQEGKCNDCHKKTGLHIDHIIPVNKWRSWRKKNKVQYKCNDIENLQGLCITCNSKKGNRILFVAD